MVALLVSIPAVLCAQPNVKAGLVSSAPNQLRVDILPDGDFDQWFTEAVVTIRYANTPGVTVGAPVLASGYPLTVFAQDEGTTTDGGYTYRKFLVHNTEDFGNLIGYEWLGGVQRPLFTVPIITPGGSCVSFELIDDAYQLSQGSEWFISLNGAAKDDGYIGGSSSSASGFNVWNISDGLGFCTIQAAIDAATTGTGDTIQVMSGTYQESLTINKGVTLLGANANVPCGARGPESHIQFVGGTPTTGMNITSANVIVDGFEISGMDRMFGIRVGGNSNVQIRYNNIHDVGGSVTGAANAAPVYGIYYSLGNVAASNVTISNNCIDDIAHTGLTGNSSGAIGILQTNSLGVLSGLSITNNNITDVIVNNGQWPTGKIAYGIQLNVGGSASTYLTTSGKVTNPIISQNVISGLTGHIATAIALEGNTENAVVTNNDVSMLSGTKVANRAGGGYDLQAVKIENNRFVGTVTINNNSFATNSFTHSSGNGLGYGVANYVPVGIAFTGGSTGTANASCNWFGTSDPTLINDNAALTGKVLNKAGAQSSIIPFLTSGTDNDPSTMGFQVPTGVCNGQGPVLNVNTNVSYFTIQSAIDAAIAGHVLECQPGVYIEELVINKPIDIRGANYNVSPNTGTRGPESILRPSYSDPDLNSPTGNVMIYVDGGYNGISINGFTIDGDNPAIGGAIDVIEALGAYSGVSNTSIKNNIIKNVSYTALDLYNYYNSGAATTGNSIHDNLFQNIMDPSWGVGILIYNNCYTSITDNVMEGVRIGIQTGNFYLADAGTSHSITGNMIESSRIGMFINMHYSAATEFNIANNDVTTLSGATNNNGFVISSHQQTVGATLSNNTVTGARNGFNLWSNPTSNTITISGGSVEQCEVGVFANNFDGYNSNGTSSNYVIDGLEVNNSSLYDVHVKDNSSNTNGATVAVAITNSTALSSTSTGLLLEGAGASATFTGATPALFNGQAVYIQQISNGIDKPSSAIDATNVLFDGVLGSAATLTQNFAIEDKIVHKMDDNAVGLVRVKAAEIFVTAMNLGVQQGVNVAAVNDLVNVAPATYDEQVLVNKSITIDGATPKPVIDFTGTVTGKPTLFDVSMPNVILRDMVMNVDLVKLSSAVIATGTSGVGGLELLNNEVMPYGSSAAASSGSYGNRNAFSVNYANYRVNGQGGSIIMTGNTIDGRLDADPLSGGVARFFRSGLSTDESHGTISTNTIRSINHDIQVRFCIGGVIDINNNLFNGGGVESAEHNAATTSVNISNNTFNGAFANAVVTPRTAVLRLKNNQSNIATSVGGNTFNDHLFGLSLENYRNVTVDGNTFTPLASSTDHVHIGLNTKSISSNSSVIVQTEVNGTFTNNVFNGSGTTGGTALGFYDHDSDNASIGTITVNANSFGGNIAQFIRLDSQTGSTNGATTPTTYPTTGSWPTTMACWSVGFDISNNQFDVGAGLQLPSAMDYTQRTALENALYHSPDAACTGTLQYFLPVTNLTTTAQYLTIQAAVNAASENDVIEASEWTYNERVIIDKPLTLQGVAMATTILDGTGLPGSGSGIDILPNVIDVTIKNITVRNYTLSSSAHAGISASDANHGLTIQNCDIHDNAGGRGGIYVNGLSGIDNVLIDNVKSHDHPSGSRGIVIWNGIKSNITISNCEVYSNNCCGIELSDGTASGITMTGNNVHDNVDNGIGLVGLGGSAGANLIANNTVVNNGRFGIELKLPGGSGMDNGVGSVVIQNNIVSINASPAMNNRDHAGISIYRRGMLPGNNENNYDIPTGVVVRNNTVSGFQQVHAGAEGYGIVVEGVDHTVTGNTVTGNDVGLQIQGGSHAIPNYVENNSGDGDQANGASPNQFGRGNAPYVCNITTAANNYSSNTVDERVVTIAGVLSASAASNQKARRIELAGTTYCTIQKAVDKAIAGQTANVHPATYDEQVLVNKSITIDGATPKPVIDFTGTVTGKPTLFDVSMPNVILRDMVMNVDLVKLSSAVIATGTSGVGGLELLNNQVMPYGSSAAASSGSYGNRNAFSVNYANYRVNGQGGSIIMTGNTIDGRLDADPLSGGVARFFRSGLSTDESHGTFSTNTIRSINHDIQVRFCIGGVIDINNNLFNGGGVESAEHNAATTSVNISNNTFNGAFANAVVTPRTAVLRLKNNQSNIATSVGGNTFNDHLFGLSLENYRNVTVDGNTFTPLASSTDYVHIGLNTKSISSNSSVIVQTEVNGTFTNNVFNGSGTTGGTALGFYDHDSDNASIGTITIGGNGVENDFNTGIGTFVRLDDQTGSSNVATTPTTYPTTGTWPTVMACWSSNIEISENFFNVGSGLQLPGSFAGPDLIAFENALHHQPDNICLGELTYLRLRVNVKALLQGPHNGTGSMNDHLRAGTYNGSVNLIPLAHPYAGSPWNHSGTEMIDASVLISQVNSSNDIVDWVLVELRDAITPSTKLATRAALIQRDGDIVDLDGVSPLSFLNLPNGNYKVAVRHRNHLGVMAMNNLLLTPTPSTVDFTAPATVTYGVDALVLSGSYMVMRTGNSRPDDRIKYTGPSNDRDPILLAVGGLPTAVAYGYQVVDNTMDGVVKYAGAGNDRDPILTQILPGPVTGMRIEQLP
jgi:hypothetical protein